MYCGLMKSSELKGLKSIAGITSTFRSKLKYKWAVFGIVRFIFKSKYVVILKVLIALNSRLWLKQTVKSDTLKLLPILRSSSFYNPI